MMCWLLTEKKGLIITLAWVRHSWFLQLCIAFPCTGRPEGPIRPGFQGHMVESYIEYLPREGLAKGVLEGGLGRLYIGLDGRVIAVIALVFPMV
ncbi:hypothetical protein HOY80DRAFT_983664 [Tuber brumale]|nr:hypothetical protein HOY80DRAFT_983664 [Tuber brumale]